MRRTFPLPFAGALWYEYRLRVFDVENAVADQGRIPMRLPPAVTVILGASLLVGCNQPLSPTSPTLGDRASLPSSLPSAGELSSNIGAARSSAIEVPFKGRFEGRLTSSTPIQPPLLSNLNVATGNATHLGRFELEIPHIVNTMTRMITGTYEFTAANGDTLVAPFTGQATPTSPGVLSVVETATISGGTGRFDGASGSFTIERVFLVATGEITGSFEGTMSSPGSAKR
jgi:hypothetical protein